jgi:hypothetical protein
VIRAGELGAGVGQRHDATGQGNDAAAEHASRQHGAGAPVGRQPFLPRAATMPVSPLLACGRRCPAGGVSASGGFDLRGFGLGLGQGLAAVPGSGEAAVDLLVEFFFVG